MVLKIMRICFQNGNTVCKNFGKGNAFFLIYANYSYFFCHVLSLVDLYLAFHATLANFAVINILIMEIKNAVFSLSSPSVGMCPKDSKPEYAFIGRSNVGKSSLINMLCRSKKLAKTSATPGKTLLINHFLINNEWYLVDLPGYGYAKRSKSEIAKLDQMIRGYILQRQQLVNVFVLVDIRHEAQKIDLEFIEWLGTSSIPFTIVFTKADKLSVGKVNQQVEAYKKVLLETWEELPPYFVTSSENRQGREDVLDYIDQINHSLNG